MPEPKPPNYVRARAAGNPESSPPAEGPPSTATAASGRTPRAGPPRTTSLGSTPPTPTSLAAQPRPEMIGGKLMPYLRAALPPDFDFGLLTACKDAPLLLQLPVRRELSEGWLARDMAVRSRSTRYLLGMLLHLTGVPAERPCSTCVAPETREECIVAGPSFPRTLVEAFGGSCAQCFYQYARWHQKNQCLLRTGAAETAAAGSKGSSDGDEAAVEDQLNGEAATEGSSGVPEPKMVNGAAGHEGGEPDPPRSLGRMEETRSTLAREEQPAANGALVSQGNLISADLLEMEDWEVAPGTIRTTADEPESKSPTLPLTPPPLSPLQPHNRPNRTQTSPTPTPTSSPTPPSPSTRAWASTS